MAKTRLSFLALVFMLVGCASHTNNTNQFDPRQLEQDHHSSFSSPPFIPTLTEVHQLTESQKEHFLSYFNSPSRLHIPAHERLYDYLDRITGNFHYQERTLNAAETLAQKRGDCMSLAVLTTALAELADIPIQYQLVDADPVYELAPNLAVRGVHVRSYLIDPAWQADSNQLTLRKPGLLIDYFPSGNERFIENLDEGEYAARFYSNLAVESLQVGDLNQAYWLSLKALEYDPLSSDVLNVLAVTYRRAGSFDDAERVYQHAINHLPNKLSALRNYELLLTAMERGRDAEAIRVKLRALDDPSPFSWYRGARDAFDRGDLADAEFFYQKAIERAPYMPELRFGLAQVYAKQGQYQLASSEIIQSLDNVWGTTNRLPYKAKLKWLGGKVSN